MHEFAIANEQESLELDEAFLQALAHAVLQLEQVPSASISIAIVTDERMHELNRRHLEHDYPTDVLSFLFRSAPPIPQEPHLKELEGEVIVSADTALREATSRGVAPEHELALYLVHGLLHLCGYDDESETDRAKMRQREQAILSQFNIHPSYE